MKSLMLSVGLLCAGTLSQAAVTSYGATLSGSAEAPANLSPGVGSVLVDIDDVLNTMRVRAVFSGLEGNTTAAHIHAATTVAGSGTAGVATTTPSFVGFPLGVTSGTMDVTYDMTLASSFRAAYITANGGTPLSAFTALKTAIADGKAYFNVHTAAYPGGEVRGFLSVVPEPSSLVLSGVTGVFLALRRRRH